MKTPAPPQNKLGVVRATSATAIMEIILYLAGGALAASVILGLILMVEKFRAITYNLKELLTMSTTSQQALADLQASAANITAQQVALAKSLSDLQNAANNIANAITALQALVASGGVAPADVENVVASLNAAGTSLALIQNGVEGVATAENAEATTVNPPPSQSPASAQGSK
jgi:hypothetical protein